MRQFHSQARESEGEADLPARLCHRVECLGLNFLSRQFQHDGGGTTPPPATSRSRSPVPTPGGLFEEPPVPAQSLVVAKTCSIRERVSYGPTSEGKPEDCDVGSSRPPWTKRRRRALCFPWSLMHQILEKGGSASSRILASLSPSPFQR